MNSIKNLNRLKRLHQLIRSECTGTPYELSRRLHVSERLVYLLVEQLRDFDALIDYDRSRQTYYYRELFDVNCIPCLVHLSYMGLGHYVVVYGYTVNKIQIMDPSVGRIYWISKSKFQRLWSGLFLALSEKNPL